MPYSLYIKYLRSISYNMKEGGLIQVLQKIGVRLAHLVYEYRQMLIVESLLSSFPPPSLHLSVARLSFHELKDTGYPKALFYPEVIEDRYSRHEECLGFYLDGTLANIMWISDGYLSISDHFPVIAIDKGIGMYDAMTFPEHRGKGVYSAALSMLQDIAVRRNSRRILAAVAPDNLHSTKGLTRAGFRYAYTLTFRRILFFFTSVVTTFEPPAGVS